MAPYSLSQPLSSVSFEEKMKFSASQSLSFARSKWFALPQTESQSVVWSIKPPDFSLKLYRSLSDPQKKDRNTHSNPVVLHNNETKRRTGVLLPKILHESYQRENPPKFITSYKPPDALESELMFVKTGKFPSGSYKNPKPHDFRQLNEDIPDIVTSYDRDPGNLNFKLKHLDIIRATRSESDFSSRDTKKRMDTFKPAEPRWDARLVLPQPTWPPKSASYTRHRRRRGAYSAFLDRVEEKLSRSWKNRS
ncbi:putative uncharacterized protein C7orf78 homolog isoform X1 [Sparus aurata]|uniref:putative uncharacterized protein C7orf78 homolog isoform X1 n=1 Tax=Sparus aurata TaxID=8175 RepID=UPI0011C18D93|nr:uncharacterized protein LOC115568085 isoform X1 [Sparus aurata]